MEASQSSDKIKVLIEIRDGIVVFKGSTSPDKLELHIVDHDTLCSLDHARDVDSALKPVVVNASDCVGILDSTKAEYSS